MAFDRNDPVQVQALSDEESLDPSGMGYAAVVGETKKTLELFNDPSLNVGNETGGAVFSHDVLMETWEPKGATNEMLPWIEALTREEGDILKYEAKYRADCGALSLASLNAISVPLSRVEVLFGQETFITRDDWAAVIELRG